MLAAGFNPAEGRHPEEVAERYHEKQALAAAHVPLPTIDLLRLYLSIEGRPRRCSTRSRRWRRSISSTSRRRSPRSATTRRRSRRWRRRRVVTFDASFSPRLEYYTGIVFEMLGEGGAVLATGGQYDRLLQRLGADRAGDRRRLRRLGRPAGAGDRAVTGLTLAIPSKGRLEEEARAAFANAGLPIERPGGARSYFGTAARQPDLAVRFMPAGEIARELIRGTIDLGITGTDLIEEDDRDERRRRCCRSSRSASARPTWWSRCRSPGST